MAGIALFVVAGAVLFTAALAAVRHLTGGATRATALLLSPLLLMPWSLLPARVLLAWPPALAGVAAGLVVFTLLADPGGRAPVRLTTD